MRARYEWMGLVCLGLMLGCSGGRGEDVSGECVSELDCPAGSVCRDGACTIDEPSTSVVSASGRAEGANADIEWIAADGVSCVQSGTTRCTVAPGSKLTLRAPTVDGHRFTGWTGGPGCQSMEPVLQLTVRDDVDCVAHYVQRVKISASTEGGTVAVRSAGEFALCADGACEVDLGDEVTLEAPQRDGLRLTGWEGEGCEGDRAGYSLRFAARADTRCLALYTPSLTVRGTIVGAQGQLQVTSTAPGADCAAETCAVDPGSTVELSAPALMGFRFVGWSGDPACSGDALMISIADVRASISCSAAYVARFTVSAESEGSDPAPVLSADSADAFARCDGAACETDQGGAVTLSAETVAGYRLSEWTGEGCQAETSGVSTTLRGVQADMVCTAHYVRGVSVTGTLVNAGGQVSASSDAAGAECANGGCVIDVGGSVVLTAPMLADRTFEGWSGDAGCSGSGLVLTLTNVQSTIGCRATYAPRYRIAGTSTPAGLGSVSATAMPANARCANGGCDVDEGTVVTLTAAPADGARFVGWSGGGACSGSAPTLVLPSASANLSCRASFVARATLRSDVTPVGTGTTRASSASAQSACSGASCTVDVGANVSITAEPATGYRFVGWSGCSTSTANPLTLAVSTDVTCSARMERITFVVAAQAGAGGSVGATVGGQACAGASCTVPYGGSVQLTAMPDGGYVFAGWSGSCTGMVTPLTIASVSEPMVCMASFTRMRFTVSASAGTGGTVSARAVAGATCTGTTCSVDYDGSVTLEAKPDPNYSFKGWSCGGTSASLPLSNIRADARCAASFELNSYSVSASAGANGSVRVTPGQGASCTGTRCSVDGGGTVSFTAVPNSDSIFTNWTCSLGAPTSSTSATLDFPDVGEAHTCQANFRRNKFTVTVESVAGISVQIRGGTGSTCSGTSCTVPEAGAVTLLAWSSGQTPVIFAGWLSCKPSTPTEVAGRTDLAFTSTLSNIVSDQRCTASSEALAVVRGWQRPGAPTPKIDKLHSCITGALGPRESENNTICRVPVSAKVTWTVAPQPNLTFSQWECWTVSTGGDVDKVFYKTPTITESGLSAGEERACQAYF